MKNIFFSTLLGILFLSAAYTQPTVTIGEVMAEGQEVIVPVSAANVTNIIGMELRIEIDTDVLEFIRIQDTQLPGQWVANYSTTQDLLIINWFGPVTNPPQGQSPSGKIFDIVFSFTGDATVPIAFNLERSRLINTQLNTVQNVTFVNGSVSPDIYSGHVSMTEVHAFENSSIVMPVTFAGIGFGAITGFSLQIEYDTDAFDFVGIEPMPGYLGITSVATGGVITVNRTGGALNLISPTHVFDIRLVYKSDSSQELKFKAESGVSSTTGPLLSRFTDGLVEPATDGALLFMEDVDLFIADIDPAGNVLEIPVFASGFISSVGSVNLVLEYDPEQLVYTGFAANQLTNWDVIAIDSEIRIKWQDDGGQTIANEKLFTLTFLYTGPINTSVSFGDKSLFRNVYFASMPVLFEGADFLITDITYTLSLVAEPEEGGQVTGGGSFAPDTEVTFSATAAGGYAFLNWTTPDGSVFSELTENTVIMTEDLSLTANFEKLEYTVSLAASPEAGGTVTGAGTYDYQEEVTIVAEAAEGYEFVNWTDGSGQLFAATPQATFDMPAENLELTANFNIIDYTLTLQVSPLNTGSVTGAGSYNFNDEVTITATPNTGYQFVNWTDLQGVEVTSEANYTFTMPSNNLTLVANFVRVFAVTFNVNMKYVDGYHHRLTFDAASDQVFVTGSMFDWADPGTAPADVAMVPHASDPDKYTLTVYLEAGQYTYKYFLNTGTAGAEWEEETNRGFFVINNNIELDDWFGSLTNPTNVNLLEAQSMKVYPNPARGILNVESPITINEVRLVDMLGQVVFTSAINGLRTQINVADFKASLYFLQVITNEGIQTHRVQVVK